MSRFANGSLVALCLAAIRLANCLLLVAFVSLFASCDTEKPTASDTLKSISLVERWSTDMPGGMDRTVFVRPAVTESQLFFVASNGNVVSKDRVTGATRWVSGGKWRNSDNVLTSGDVVVVASDSVVAFDARTGAERWRFWSGYTSADCAASANATTVYVCSADWRVIALDATTGSVRWIRELRDSLGGLPTLVGTAISGDTVYAAIRQKYSEANGFTVGLIFAISATNGTLLTKLQDGNYTDFTGYISAPTIAGRLLIISHTLTNKLSAVDRFTGRKAWTVFGDPGWVGFAYPAVVSGDTVVAASGDRRVYALEASTGRVLWKSAILDGSQTAAEVCGDFVLSWASIRTIVLDRRTGKQLSVLDANLEPARSFTTPPFSSNNELFVMSQRDVRKYTC
jgi:outer membrane protein assembly factor BamB